MKKILVCALVLVMCLTAFVACNPTDAQPDLTQLNSAKEYLQTMLNDVATSTGADFTRPAVLAQFNCTVEWTINVTSGSADNIVAGAVENGVITFDVDEFASEETVYTLTATIKDANNNTTTLTFNHKVPAFAVNTYAEYIAACEANDEETVITVKGYVVGVNADSGSSSVGSLWIVDEDGKGYYAYKPTLDSAITESRETINAAFPLGTEVVVKGTVTKYGGCYEFNKDCEIIYTGNSVDPSTLPYVDLTELYGSASSMTDEATLKETQSIRASLNGVTMGVIDGYNYHFSVNGVDYIFYMNIYLLSEEDNATLAAKWVVGGKANLKGVINVYSSKYQLYPDSLDSIEIVTEDLTDAEKVARQKDLLTLEETYNDNFTLPAGTWANVSWAVTGAGATIGENNAVTINQTSVEQTVTFTATITSGEATDTKEFSVKIAAARTSFIKAALNAAGEDGTTTEDSYIIIGTVSEIDSAYSEQYGNVSFYVADAEGNSILVYRYNLDDAATIAVGDAVAFAAPIKNYKGTIEAVSTFTALDVMTLTDAAAAGIAGTGVEGTVVYGYVKSIDTEYSSQYGNITITISDGTNELYCYRVAGGEDIVVGEYLLITGTPSAYKGAAQMAQGATYSRSSIYVAPGTDEPGTDEPAEAVTTIADALTAAVGTAAELSGTVVGITEAWSSYNNMSFYISDGTNRILVFRTGTQVGLGDVVSVVGSIGVFDNVNQIAQGSTTTVTTAHTCSTYTDATCTDPAECTVCGKENGAALGHTEANSEGKCDRCGADLSIVTLTATAAYTGTTTGNMTGENDAATIGLDATIFSAVSEKTNGGQNHVGLNKAGNIRLYKGETSTLTISIASGYKIVSVEIVYAASTKAAGVLVVTNGTDAITGANDVYTVNGSKVVLSNSGTDQVHIASIVITYAEA